MVYKNNYNSVNLSYDHNPSDIRTTEVFFDKLIWGIDEVARFTRYSKGTIYNLVSEGDIPYRKKRGRLWFIPSEVISWLKGEL